MLTRVDPAMERYRNSGKGLRRVVSKSFDQREPRRRLRPGVRVCYHRPLEYGSTSDYNEGEGFTVVRHDGGDYAYVRPDVARGAVEHAIPAGYLVPEELYGGEE